MKLPEDMLDMDLSYARVRFFLAKLWVVIKTVNKNLDKLNEKENKQFIDT